MKNLPLSILFILSVFPFVGNAQHWVEAGYIKEGDKLINSRNESLEIVNVKMIPVVENVFNMEVEDWHTYYVGKALLLTHNKDKGYNLKTKNCSPGDAKKVKEDFDDVKSIVGISKKTKTLTIQCVKDGESIFSYWEKEGGRVSGTIKYDPNSQLEIYNMSTGKFLGQLSPRDALAHELPHFNFLANSADPVKANSPENMYGDEQQAVQYGENKYRQAKGLRPVRYDYWLTYGMAKKYTVVPWKTKK